MRLFGCGGAGRGVVGSGQCFRFSGQAPGRLFPESMMEDLFPSRRGPPWVPAPVIGPVLVLQALQGLSDRETAEALTIDLRWKGKLRRAVDSTVLNDAVARQDTVTQLIAGIRRFGRDVPGGPELLSIHAAENDYTRAGEPDIAWEDQDAKDGLISALVTETMDGKAADAYALVALVAGQDVEPAEDSDGTDGRWRIARTVAPDRMLSTVDPDARHAHKTRAPQQDGFMAHIVLEPDTGLVTAAELTNASGP